MSTSNAVNESRLLFFPRPAWEAELWEMVRGIYDISKVNEQVK